MGSTRRSFQPLSSWFSDLLTTNSITVTPKSLPLPEVQCYPINILNEAHLILSLSHTTHCSYLWSILCLLYLWLMVQQFPKLKICMLSLILLSSSPLTLLDINFICLRNIAWIWPSFSTEVATNLAHFLILTFKLFHGPLLNLSAS